MDGLKRIAGELFPGLFLWNFQLIPVRLADEFGEVATIRRFSAQSIACFTLVGRERNFANLAVRKRNLLVKFHIIEFNVRHTSSSVPTPLLPVMVYMLHTLILYDFPQNEKRMAVVLGHASSSTAMTHQTIIYSRFTHDTQHQHAGAAG